MRLHLFDNFRAIAILLVVAGHSINSRNIASLGEMFFANTILGGTTLFVFISGFFFYHIYYYKFQYKNFMLKKIKYVFMPYFMLSAIGFVFSVFYVHKLPLSPFFFELFLKYLLTGGNRSIYQNDRKSRLCAKNWRGCTAALAAKLHNK